MGNARRPHGGGGWLPASPAAPLLLLLLVVSLLAGCAQVPTSGSVHEGREVSVRGDGPYLQLLASGPRAGDSPLRIVRGFLQASASLEDDSSVARGYLVPEQRDRWDPAAGVTLYDNDPTVTKSGVPFTLTEQPGGLVQLRARDLGQLDARGRYSARPGHPVLTVVFQLTRINDEWRIANPPPGLLLTRDDIARAFRPLDVYFLDPTQSLLVPDRVFLPIRAGLATALLRRLFEGPSTWLAPSVTTAIPADTHLDVSSVPVEDGVAMVRLNRSVLQVGADQRRALSAQIVWTLRQVPQVRAVSLTVDGQPLAVPGVGDVQMAADWPTFLPAALGETIDAYFVRDHRLLRLRQSRVLPVAGQAGDPASKVVFGAYAVSPLNDKVAAVSADGRSLLVAPLADGGRWQSVVTGQGLTSPSWDGLGRLWMAGTTAKGSILVRFWAGRSTVARLPPLDGRTITAVRVARDGTRLAIRLIDPKGAASLLVGRVRDATGSAPLVVDGFYQVGAGLDGIDDLAWSGGGQLSVLVGAGTPDAQVRVVDADGYSTTAAGSVPGATALAAAPFGQPMLVGTTAGVVQQAQGTRWVQVCEGQDPSYPR